MVILVESGYQYAEIFLKSWFFQIKTAGQFILLGCLSLRKLVLNPVNNLETSQKMLESKVGRDRMGLYPLDYYAARPFNPPSYGHDVRRHKCWLIERAQVKTISKL